MQKQGQLSDTEFTIMQKIWESNNSVTVAEMLKLFQNDKSWKAQTMSTFLTRLVDKGFLSRTAAGKTNVFTPTSTKAEYINAQTSGFLTAMHNGSIKNFLTALVDNVNLSASEIDELREWLDKGEHK